MGEFRKYYNRIKDRMKHYHSKHVLFDEAWWRMQRTHSDSTIRDESEYIVENYWNGCYYYTPLNIIAHRYNHHINPMSDWRKISRYKRGKRNARNNW